MTTGSLSTKNAATPVCAMIYSKGICGPALRIRIIKKIRIHYKRLFLHRQQRHSALFYSFDCDILSDFLYSVIHSVLPEPATILPKKCPPAENIAVKLRRFKPSAMQQEPLSKTTKNNIRMHTVDSSCMKIQFPAN